MADESSLWARIRALAQMIVELKARVTALEQRLATLEQSQSQRWFQ